ncbi:hypothetical protein [Ruegeria sp. HKCCD6604]|uniref:hypothetical protein n=1 Tax=Ruegeria sp. HKCCD6604 TaxID=2683000 RepID=UPI001491AA38|nr:hypothetical protein [Ruegeria sp. HKCCD6604]NOC91563.1 hypothetical protein [Ruegeria sp. HKCCD6604]
MRRIDVETSIFALIWALRESGEESENDILFRVLSEFKSIKDSEAQSLRAESEETQLSSESTQQPTGSFESLEVKSSKKIQGQTFERERPMGKIRWVDDVFEAIRKLGGRATLHSIYREVENIRRDAGRSVPKTLDATIRRTLEDHSSDSANYRGTDLFANTGRGEWEIRQDRRA